MSNHHAQPHQHDPHLNQTSTKLTNNFNYFITKFFLDNSRLTFLTLIFLVILGVATTFLLKTTGFPSPEVGVAIIRTNYIGAPSETVLKDVTQPLENAIKGVDGIESYQSFSSNNNSTITATFKAGTNPDSVRSKIDSAVKSVTLPSGADTPVIDKPSASGPDFVFSIVGPNPESLYRTYQQFQADLNQLPETGSIEVVSGLNKRIQVKINVAEMNARRITLDQVQSKLKTLGETLPVASNVTLAVDGGQPKNYSLTTTLKEGSLEDIRNLQFAPATPAAVQSGAAAGNATSASASASRTPSAIPSAASQAAPLPTPIRLSDFATVDYSYQFGDAIPPQISLRTKDGFKVFTPIILQVRTTKGAPQADYAKKIEDKIKNYGDANFVTPSTETSIDTNKAAIIENYTVNESNQEQVNEVVSGLIGGPLKGVNAPASYIGWVLGGIQLVFLVMLAFVSWRAAVIAALSIPLSLMFSNIYLFLIGESYNTLVLFSLVLVIGLVVDPALVILESIQRKVDTGLRGREAALAAVKDVGNGLFLATLTNIIVFLPFGVISGVIGQIFAYIPMTVIPATIGSYIVPLVFLAWIGGLILKPSKNKTEDEEQNLWGVAKGLIGLNRRILNSPVLVRLVIILLGLIIPFSIAAYYTSTGQVKSVQFASDDNTNAMSVAGQFLPTIPEAERSAVAEDTVRIIADNRNVKEIFPIRLSNQPSNQFGVSYYITLTDRLSRSEKSTDIANELTDKLQDKYGERASSPKFFDIRVDTQQVGPPTASYQVALAVKSNDQAKLKTAALDIAATLKKVCYRTDLKFEEGSDLGGQIGKLRNNAGMKRSGYVVSDNCDGGTQAVVKVDDGYTGKENKTLEIVLDRNKLEQNNLTSTSLPLATALVNQQVRNLFQLGDGKVLKTVQIESGDLGIVLDKTAEDPATLEAILNTELTTLTGQKVPLREVSSVQETTPKASIQRVKSQTIGVVNARLADGRQDQANAAQVTQAVLKHYQDNDAQKLKDLGLTKESLEQYSQGSTAETQKSLTELLTALLLAIVLTYFVLALFFGSFSQPLVVLYTIPLTFIGMYPGLAYFGGGQIGFLEIIGIIILIGIVENVAIFLIDAARQKIVEDDWDDKRAISYAAGLRLRPVLMTKFTAIASLAPLAVLSVFYRSISVVIMFGLLTSGFLSLITTPILFIFFRWLSENFHAMKWWHKVLFLIPALTPFYLIAMWIRTSRSKRQETKTKSKREQMETKLDEDYK